MCTFKVQNILYGILNCILCKWLFYGSFSIINYLFSAITYLILCRNKNTFYQISKTSLEASTKLDKEKTHLIPTVICIMYGHFNYYVQIYHYYSKFPKAVYFLGNRKYRFLFPVRKIEISERLEQKFYSWNSVCLNHAYHRIQDHSANELKWIPNCPKICCGRI